MARLRITLHKVCCFEKDTDLKPGHDLSVSTEKETATAFFQVGDTRQNYTLNLIDFNFKKKMYQPTEVTAVIQITMTKGDSNLIFLGREELIKLFRSVRVSLEELNAKEAGKIDTMKQVIGRDYYVQDVYPSFKPGSMFVTLKIYSVDKLLTLDHYSRSFVRKKLIGDILNDELKPNSKDKSYKYPLPYDEKETISVKYNGAKQLFYQKDNAKDKLEHIFPYLVQYNESFYDMLARTTNRWGEFLYYEDGKLNIGYDDSKVEKIESGYADISYIDLDSESQNVPKDQKYNFAGSEEKGFLDNALRKSPNTISGTLFYPTFEKMDKVLMKEFTAFLKNEKNIPTWIGNRLFEGTWDMAVMAANVNNNNRDFDKKYFPSSDKPGLNEQYGNHDFSKTDKPDVDTGYNLFSEMDSKYKSSEYEEILKKEYLAAKGAVCIDFNTTCPELKLGSVIEVVGEKFIVVEISSCIKEETDYKNNESGQIYQVVTRSLVFKVIATAINGDRFYPTVIPAGHVRMADPQIGTITDAKDPGGKNRVRVMFEAWQKIGYKDPKKKDKITDDCKEASSPWLTFAAGAAGSPTIGKHYEQDKVLVGFIDGNIERPYVIGGLSSKGDTADYIQTTPGGHKIKMQDDVDGIKSFLTGMFLPCIDTFGPFINFIPGFKKLIEDYVLGAARGYEYNIAMGGGFEISDNYGIYKITGSTDGREVSVASPWGDVNISAFTGINISAPNGDVCIKGKNIKLEAGNNVEIVSGTNIKNKMLGDGGKSGFFEDIGVAVAKKLADKLINVVDLSLVRSAAEIIFRPAEGQLRIKSNRFLMLDAGKGDCAYPENAFVDKDTYKGYLAEQSKEYARKGLILSSGVVEMVSRVKTLGDLMDSRYRNAYNKCVDKLKLFKEKIKEAQKWAQDYNSINFQEPEICNTYSVDAFKDKLWADATNRSEISMADLAFKANYNVTDRKTVKEYMARRLAKQRNVDIYDLRFKVTEFQDKVLELRKTHQQNIKNAANDLRQAIREFLLFDAALNADNDIKTTVRSFRDRKMPKEFMESLVKAFKKSELGADTYYFLPITDAKKANLKNLAGELSRADTKVHRQVLKRKAATLLLEGMGFKDEWRKKVAPVAGAVAPPPPPTTALIKNTAGAEVLVPLVPPAPPAPELEVKREFESSKLTDLYWSNYVNSLESVPPMKADEWKVSSELRKVKNAALDKMTGGKFWEMPSENKAWSNAENGAILFSSNAKVFNLLNNEIKEVPTHGRENLNIDTDNGKDFTSYLNEVKRLLNHLDADV